MPDAPHPVLLCFIFNFIIYSVCAHPHLAIKLLICRSSRLLHLPIFALSILLLTSSFSSL